MTRSLTMYSQIQRRKQKYVDFHNSIDARKKHLFQIQITHIRCGDELRMNAEIDLG